MNKRLIGAIAVVALAACSSGGGGSTIPSSQDSSGTPVANYKMACDVMAPGTQDVCFALVRTDTGGAPQARSRIPEAGSSPAGYGPSQLQAAYALASAAASNGSGQTVALLSRAIIRRRKTI